MLQLSSTEENVYMCIVKPTYLQTEECVDMITSLSINRRIRKLDMHAYGYDCLKTSENVDSVTTVFKQTNIRRHTRMVLIILKRQKT